MVKFRGFEIGKVLGMFKKLLVRRLVCWSRVDKKSCRRLSEREVRVLRSSKDFRFYFDMGAKE